MSPFPIFDFHKREMALQWRRNQGAGGGLEPPTRRRGGLSSPTNRGNQSLECDPHDDGSYVHCFGHSLNLCMQEVAKKCELIRNTMEFISQLVQLIKFSPQVLQFIQQCTATNCHFRQ